MSNARAGFTAVFVAGLLAASCGGGGYGGGSSSPTNASAPAPTTTGTTTGAADVVITIAGMSFTPSNVVLQAGQTVAWKNNDTIGHTATQDGGGFDTGMIPSGGTSKAITITDPTALKYHCSVHPGMVGSLNGSTGGGGGY
jgi:plastocyanin